MATVSACTIYIVTPSTDAKSTGVDGMTRHMVARAFFNE
jgi:hypothetical protein